MKCERKIMSLPKTGIGISKRQASFLFLVSVGKCNTGFGSIERKVEY